MKTAIRPTERAAMRIALKAGLIRPCLRHWVYLKSPDNDSFEHAIRLGNYLISHYSRSVACFKGNRSRLADALVKYREQLPLDCPECGKSVVNDRALVGRR